LGLWARGACLTHAALFLACSRWRRKRGRMRAKARNLPWLSCGACMGFSQTSPEDSNASSMVNSARSSWASEVARDALTPRAPGGAGSRGSFLPACILHRHREVAGDAASGSSPSAPGERAESAGPAPVETSSPAAGVAGAVPGGTPRRRSSGRTPRLGEGPAAAGPPLTPVSENPRGWPEAAGGQAQGARAAGGAPLSGGGAAHHADFWTRVRAIRALIPKERRQGGQERAEVAPGTEPREVEPERGGKGRQERVLQSPSPRRGESGTGADADAALAPSSSSGGEAGADAPRSQEREKARALQTLAPDQPAHPLSALPATEQPAPRPEPQPVPQPQPQLVPAHAQDPALPSPGPPAQTGAGEASPAPAPQSSPGPAASSPAVAPPHASSPLTTSSPTPEERPPPTVPSDPLQAAPPSPNVWATDTRVPPISISPEPGPSVPASNPAPALVRASDPGPAATLALPAALVAEKGPAGEASALRAAPGAPAAQGGQESSGSSPGSRASRAADAPRPATSASTLASSPPSRPPPPPPSRAKHVSSPSTAPALQPRSSPPQFPPAPLSAGARLGSDAAAAARPASNPIPPRNGGGSLARSSPRSLPATPASASFAVQPFTPPPLSSLRQAALDEARSPAEGFHPFIPRLSTARGAHDRGRLRPRPTDPCSDLIGHFALVRARWSVRAGPCALVRARLAAKGWQS